jgi:hypothetical protein
MAIDGPGVEPQVEELKRLLEQELEQRARPFQGCWPVAVAIAGLLLAAALIWTRS